MRSQNAFRERFIVSAGMFASDEMGAQMHAYYFSPGAAGSRCRLLKPNAGSECDAQVRSDVLILVAHSGAEEIPFSLTH